MVFAPRMPVDAETLGLGSPLPRAVPSDLVVALASHVIPGQLVQKTLLLLLLAVAGFGAARLCPGGTVARTAAGLAYLWTPYLAERLLLGQWTVLVGYAGLPWLVLAAADIADGRRAAWARLIAVAGLMSLGGAPAWVLIAITTPVIVLWASPRSTILPRIFGCAGLLGVLALPWALPALLRPGSSNGDISGASVFAPRSDTPFGLLVTVLTGGGVWNADAVPPGRDTVIGALGALLLLGVAIVGWCSLHRTTTILAVCATAVFCLGVVLIDAWEPAARGIARLPAGALLRDAQRLLAPWVLLVAICFGAGVAWIVRRVGGQAGAIAIMCCALPVVVLPSLAWGIGGRLVPVDYPADFARVRQVLENDHRPGGVAVLPFATYRRFLWNGGRTSLDPLPRWLDGTVVTSSALPVSVHGNVVIVLGEDRLADRVATALAGPAPANSLGRLGIRWVVADGPVSGEELAALRPRYVGADVSLYEVPQVSEDRARNPVAGLAAPRFPVIAADLVTAGVIVAACFVALFASARRLLRSVTRT
jgi:hypothetical protein